MAAYAGSLAIPNVFVKGTVADANEVNDNFDAVEIEVNDNDARISALEANSFSCTNATRSGSTSPGSPSFTVATCPGGFTMTGGGCDTTGGPGVNSRELFESYPNGNGWACAHFHSSGSTTLSPVAYARCCRLQ